MREHATLYAVTVAGLLRVWPVGFSSGTRYPLEASSGTCAALPALMRIDSNCCCLLLSYLYCD